MAPGLEKGTQETWTLELSETGGIDPKADPSSVGKVASGQLSSPHERRILFNRAVATNLVAPHPQPPQGRKMLPSQEASGTQDLRPPAPAE